MLTDRSNQKLQRSAQGKSPVDRTPEPPPLQKSQHDLIPEVGAMREGARDQLDRVMRTNLPDLLGLAVRLTDDHHRAEELVQETMLRAVRNWSGFRGEANPKTWLVSIVINVFRDSLRNKTNQQEQLTTEIATEAEGPEQHTLQRELGEQVARQVSSLPPRQREVLVLTVYEGLGVKEVGNILNMKPSNVYTTLHHARTTLKERLRPFLDTAYKTK